ncbi:LysM peptidoglycan-binding domain-containing protein [Limosilactobacillus agrestimuris]|uniref:aggregation-promoting factor n=1 Tax=Limosilactobacillus agrestimuris TaxID=2941331 RepID=UPI00203EB347|nr:LysM domain-containing protein [Limosilactobacillus agrestimuris]
MISKKKLAKLTASIGAVVFGVAATQAAANADTIYTVKSGDTLSSISYKFNKDNSLVNKIAQQNSIKDINKIYVGQRLVIKSDGEIQVAPSQTTTQKSTTTNNGQQSATSTVSGSDAAAKAWIANRESGGNYGATNGQYIGKYQLSASYLNGDYSAANQERVADQYVASRYGSWTAAQQHWIANGWY